MVEEIVTPEEEQALQEQELQFRIEAFGNQLIEKRKLAIRARAESGVESRWSKDLDLYHGLDGNRISKDGDIFEDIEASREKKGGRRRSRVFVQVTRQKTNAASARLSDMLFPTNDRNWEIGPTPVPKLSNALKEYGNVAVRDEQPGPTQGQILPHPTEDRPLKAADVLVAQMSEATAKASAMQKEIDDQLTECNFNREGRKAIRDAAKMGTGILKGPIVINRVKKRWKRQSDGQRTVHVLEVVEEERPASMRVNPWDFFPAPGCGEEIRKAAYIWEREIIARADFADLARLGDESGYSREAILECLKEGPKRNAEAISHERKRYSNGYIDMTSIDPTNYELWNYHGEVLVEDLEAFGVKMTEEELAMAKLSAIVVLCNDRVIKVVINPMETGDHPYDVFSWESMDGSPFGVGIPYLMRYGQITLNAAWRQMQDNAGVTHGPQVVLNKRAITPATGEWDIHGMKLWYAMDNTVDVRTAFQVFQIEDRQESLQRIIELALKFIDEETALPMIAQGERGTAPDKVGVATLLMNSANTVLKQIARNWDDCITNPHITRYYDWNMQNNDNEEIKGDFSVKARGSTALVVRDQQKQDVIMVANMAQSPTFQKFINPQRLAKYAIEASSIPDVMNTDAEIAKIEEMMAKQPPPVAPAIEAAKIRAQADLEAAKIDAISEQANIEQKGQQMSMDDQRETLKMQLDRELMILKYAQERQMTLEQVKAELAMFTLEQKADLQKEAMRVQADREKTIREADAKTKEIAA